VEKCVTCQFYDRRSSRPSDGRTTMWGQCRRHSPHLNPTTAKSYLVEGVWPLIRDDDWCGEWKALTRPAVAPSRFAPRTVETTAPAAIPRVVNGHAEAADMVAAATAVAD
jgi:hypothetical protein